MNEVLLSEVFLKIVNMSISASWLILAILLLRLVLKKAPKWVSVLLWGLVAVRLICPFSIESMLSLIPSAETISPEIMMDRTPEISTGISSVDTVINPIITQTFTPQPLASANPLQILIPLAAIVWIGGIVIMLIYTAVSYLLLRRKVATAVLLRSNIYQSENVDSPFVLGILKPKIYLPFRMDRQNMEHVIAHEASHIRRKDHWWKPTGFLLLALHWFNPLMWLGYILLCRDIELACDEKVIKEMDNENRADYTQALVACSVNHRSIAACPLAFGEVGVRERVKSVMNYKKPTFWIVIAAIVICAAAAVCFLTDPVENGTEPIYLSAQAPTPKYPWVQEYIPGADGIVGNVDTEKYVNISTDFEIGADWRGMAVFKDPHKAFVTMTSLYADAIAAIGQEFDLPALSELNYTAYKTYGWQITSGSAELREQATFVSQFFDIYENSFADDSPDHATKIVNTITTDLKTYYELSDGTWMADGYRYLYRLEITGRMHDAAADSTFVYLSNLEAITFDQAQKAAGLSSNMDDYFTAEEAVLVEWVSGGNDSDFSANGIITDRNGVVIAAESIDKAITGAILEKNAGDNFLDTPSGHIHVESHYMLGIVSKSGTPLAGQTNHMEEITVYIQYAYHRYYYSGGNPERIAARGTPAMITFSKNTDGRYTLKEFWEPNEGSLYAEDIRKRFPEDIADMVLNSESDVIDTEALEDKCLTKAQEYISGLSN